MLRKVGYNCVLVIPKKIEIVYFQSFYITMYQYVRKRNSYVVYLNDLFSLYMNDIVNVSDKFRYLLFVDNTTILNSHKTNNNVENSYNL